MPDVPEQPAPPEPQTPTPLWRWAVGVAGSVLIIGGVLLVVGLLSGDRLKQGDAAAPPAAPHGKPSAERSAPPVRLPEGSEEVPRMLYGHREGDDRILMATVPGMVTEVRDFFLRQMTAEGWTVTVVPSSSERPAVTLLVENAGRHRMITILKHPARPVCTVAVHEMSD